MGNFEQYKLYQQIMEMMRRRHGQDPQHQPNYKRPIPMPNSPANQLDQPMYPTFSDTPGYGNVRPYQMPGMQNVPDKMYEPFGLQHQDPRQGEQRHMEQMLNEWLQYQQSQKPTSWSM
jgi:hypothetical protein